MTKKKSTTSLVRRPVITITSKHDKTVNCFTFDNERNRNTCFDSAICQMNSAFYESILIFGMLNGYEACINKSDIFIIAKDQFTFEEVEQSDLTV